MILPVVNIAANLTSEIRGCSGKEDLFNTPQRTQIGLLNSTAQTIRHGKNR